jgi:phosphatidylserine/phosphatidylglycerophosphate/cardiolipin synthase-like enzyme
VVKGNEVKLYFSPMDNAINFGVIPLIQSAKESVHVAMFYLTNSDVIEELINAKNRGVDVKVIVDSSLKYEKQARHIQLIDAGVPVKIEDWRGKLHQKSATIDGKYTIVASTNWTKSANIVNDENMLVIKSEEIAKIQEKEFLRLWKSIRN